MKSWFAHRGFTVVELLVTLVLVAVIALIAVPSMQSLSNYSRVTSSVNTLVSSLRLARSEAIKRNTRVVICKSSDGLQCSNSGNWDKGWLVFVDTNNNASVEDGESILLVEKAAHSTLKASGNAPITSYISYTPFGMTQTTSGSFQAGTLTVCSLSNGSTEGRQIVISSSGRVRTQRATLSNCV